MRGGYKSAHGFVQSRTTQIHTIKNISRQRVPDVSWSGPVLKRRLSTVGCKCAVTAACTTALAPSLLPRKGPSRSAMAVGAPMPASPVFASPLRRAAPVGVESACGLGERERERDGARRQLGGPPRSLSSGSLAMSWHTSVAWHELG